MVVPPAEPGATADLGTPEAGSTRKLLLDEMLAERDREPLPPAPVLTLHPVPVDAAPVGAGRRGALKRLAEVEALARNNLRAAEEAQRVMQAERVMLEEEASARTRAERTAGALRRELERLRSTEEQRAAQARFAATHQAKVELATEMDRVHDEHTRVVDELDRMRGTLLDHDSLLDEYSQRLHDEQELQAKGRAELVRAEEAQRAAERNLEIATETARRRAEDDHTRLVKVEEELRDTVVERDRATTELLALTTGDGEVARLRVQADAAHEDMTRLLADLDIQAVRADRAESELVGTREACEQAEHLAAEASEARDLAGIALETTRDELAARNELLDAERSEAQARVAELSAQLSTVTRIADGATERVTELESQLDAAVASRADAVLHADDYSEQLEHALADAEQLRKHAASIGDELAATHLTLEEVRAQLANALRPVAAPTVAPVEPAPVAAMAPVETPPVETRPVEMLPVEMPATDLSPAIAAAGGPSAFDAAIASAFRDTIRAEVPVEVTGSDDDSAITTFRTVESTHERPTGGPIVEREAALLRQVAPVDPAPVAGDEEADPDAPAAAEPETWRRTAMAEFSALAADSDDLTPRRRR